jgi:outer membrane protein assembly factor BamB
MSTPPPVRVRAALGCLAALLWAGGPAEAQQRPPEPVIPGAGQADARLPLLARLLPQYAAEKDWDTLAHALQALLDTPGGALMQERLEDPTGRPYVRWSSPQAVAGAVLNKLPAGALRAHEDFYGPVGRERLARALKRADERALAAVGQSYLYTEAGAEALALLAERQTRSGRHLPAALCYRLLLRRSANPPALTLYRAALAFRKVGDAKATAQTWERVEARVGKDSLQIDGDKLTAAQLKQRLDAVRPAAGVAASDWPLFGGNAARNAQATGGRPDLRKPLWQRATLMDRNDETGELDRGGELKRELDRILPARLRLTEPALPGFFPLAVGDLLVYRTYLGVSAVALVEIKDKDGKVETRPGEIEWKSPDLDGSLALLLATPRTRAPVLNWLQTYEKLKLGNLLYENPTVGTLACDGPFVYLVDDLALPPPTAAPFAPPAAPPPDLEALVRGNSLHAFELETGKIAWRLGNGEPKDDPFAGGFWLGPPLPLGGALYALHEKAGAVSLVCLQPGEKRSKVLSLRHLARVQDPYGKTAARRLQPAHLAYGDGVLVCPTHAGAVLGVDLATQTPLWAYTYREGKLPPPRRAGKPAPPPLPPRQEWRSTVPVVVGERVVFTAPDEDSVHCLNLRDGSLVWRRGKQAEDLYLAGVHGGRVLVVGKTNCRALDLASGREVWQVETGVPSGMGVAVGDTYYLPLLSAAGEQQPGVSAIDLQKGRVVRFIPSGKTAPGNLLFHRGQLITQGPTTITAYPLVKGGKQ